MDDVAERHLAVCLRFGQAVAAADGKWHRRSPCEDWDARGVLEHVIGFHDVLLLRPLGFKPDRPRDDQQSRWQATYTALATALKSRRAERSDAYLLLPSLTRDVLVHTWDLARAVGADDRLDPGWCEAFCTSLPPEHAALIESGMFSAPVAVSGESDAQVRLLALLGRDPFWPNAL